MQKYIALLMFVVVSLAGHAQEVDSTKFEAGAALNRYVPDRENEKLPYFISAEFRYKFLSTPKFDHMINVRIASNINRSTMPKVKVLKRYIAAEAGYHARWRRDSTNWRFAWGVNAGVYYIDENISQIALFPALGPPNEPFNRERYKFALSPQISAEYYLNSLTFVQVAFSMSVGTRYFGDTDHLEFNLARGFSAQAPSIGIFRKF